MVKLGILNSRMKDFFDIWLMLRQYDFEGPKLATAIVKTFSVRRTDITTEPIALTSSFAEDPAKDTQWRAFIRKNRLTNVSPDLGEVVKAIAAFLGPIAKSVAAGKPFKANWSAPGPWSE